jgi:uncharacterized repeat protein (TIGR01451 family)
MKHIFALTALFAPAAALAQVPAAPAGSVKLTSETFVAKAVTDAKGVKSNKLFPATRVLPGDPIVFQLTYNNLGKAPAARFVINNPVPNGVEFTGVREASATVSVDGGKTFGTLSSLKVKGVDGKLRGAVNADVTQIRWSFAQPIAVGAKGNVMFYGLVK